METWDLDPLSRGLEGIARWPSPLERPAQLAVMSVGECAPHPPVDKADGALWKRLMSLVVGK
jgi:hypothetical protein